MKLYLGVLASTPSTSKVDESGKKIGDDVYSSFICPTGMGSSDPYNAIIGRWHLGDENGKTEYRYGPITILNKHHIETFTDARGTHDRWEVYMSDIEWSDWCRESKSSFTCPTGTVMVAREHKGDENGDSRIGYRRVFLKDVKTGEKYKILRNVEITMVDIEKESSGIYAEAYKKEVYHGSAEEVMYYELMISRSHDGDENASTLYSFSTLEFDTITDTFTL